MADEPGANRTGARCALCRGDLNAAFAVHGHDIFECAACGHRQLDVERLPARAEHVAEIYGDTYFSGGGAGYTDYVAEGRLLRARGRKYADVLARYVAVGRVLDVGAAAGFVLAGLLDGGWQGVGVEPNASMAAYGRETLNLNLTSSSFEDLPVGDPFDAVVMVQVMAHFTDPAAALSAAARHLRPGGVLLVETWDCASRTARIFGRRWHEYSPPSVVHWFTRTELSDVAAGHGLSEVGRGRLLKWIDARHAVSLAGHSVPAIGNVARRLGRLVPSRLRLPYPSEDLFWMVFRRAG